MGNQAKNKGPKSPGERGDQNRDFFGDEGHRTEDRADFFIRCSCDNLICRQSKEDAKTFRFKEKEFYLEVNDPVAMSTRCRRCARTVHIPNRASKENFDIVKDFEELGREMEEKRKGHESPRTPSNA